MILRKNNSQIGDSITLASNKKNETIKELLDEVIDLEVRFK